MATEGVFDNRKTKRAAEEIVYWIDWTTRGLRAGDTIATSAWAFVGDDGDLTKDSETTNAANTIAYVRVMDGTVGGPYQLRNTITTNNSPVETLVEDLFITVE